jgi:hypothetical protein
MMEDLRQDLLNDKLDDSDTDHDMTLMKMKILIFPNYMHFLQESEVKHSLKCLQFFSVYNRMCIHRNTTRDVTTTLIVV